MELHMAAGTLHPRPNYADVVKNVPPASWLPLPKPPPEPLPREALEPEFQDYDVEYLAQRLAEKEELADELRQLIGDCQVKLADRLHEKAKAATSVDFAVFYRYFFAKCVANLQAKDAGAELVRSYARIFPFRVNSAPAPRRVFVRGMLDDGLLNEVRQFAECHFDDCDFLRLVDLLLINVDQFRCQRFKDEQVASFSQLKRIAETGLNAKNWRKDPRPEFLSKYVNGRHRLNEEGVLWLQRFQTVYNKLAEIYSQELLAERTAAYFRYLPEVNVCELLLLLDADFLRLYRDRYIHLFKKYLFFFTHAIQNDSPNPVFYIDETLFACLKWLKRFETFRGDMLKFQWEVWMMALVHRRKYPVAVRRADQKISLQLDVGNLADLMMYTGHLPDLQSSTLDYLEPQYPLRFRIFMVSEDIAFWMGYSRRHVQSVEFFFEMILKCALLSKGIRRIVYYNAYWGEEASIEMPSARDEIVNFIRRNNVFLPNLPQGFCVQELQEYFVKPKY